MVLAPGEVLILRIDYTPSAHGVLDRADLIISSTVGAPLVIPMCGMGLFVDAGLDEGPDAGLDAGPDAGPEEIPDAGSVECPQCGDALSADAPGCNNNT